MLLGGWEERPQRCLSRLKCGRRLFDLVSRSHDLDYSDQHSAPIFKQVLSLNAELFLPSLRSTCSIIVFVHLP